jgi:hypothetical protein
MLFKREVSVYEESELHGGGGGGGKGRESGYGDAGPRFPLVNVYPSHHKPPEN